MHHHTVTPTVAGWSAVLYRAVLQRMGCQRQSSALRVEKVSAVLVMWDAGLLQQPYLNGPPQGLGGMLRPKLHIPQLGCGPLMDEQRAQAGQECRNGGSLGHQHLRAYSTLWPFDVILPCPQAMSLAADTMSKLVVTPHSTLY